MMLLQFAAGRFHIKKLSCRLVFFWQNLNFTGDNSKSRFVSPFGDLGVTYMVHSWLVEKRVVDFLLVLIILSFASSHGWGAMGRYLSKSWCSKGGWVTLSANFTGERGRPPTTVNVRKWRCLRDPTFSRFDTIPACDRQTDRHTRRLIPAHS